MAVRISSSNHNMQIESIVTHTQHTYVNVCTISNEMIRMQFYLRRKMEIQQRNLMLASLSPFLLPFITTISPHSIAAAAAATAALVDMVLFLPYLLIHKQMHSIYYLCCLSLSVKFSVSSCFKYSDVVFQRA